MPITCVQAVFSFTDTSSGAIAIVVVPVIVTYIFGYTVRYARALSSSRL